MPEIQELLTVLHRAPAEEADAQIEAIIQTLLTQDKLLVGWFPPTKHYFIVREFGQQTAVLFSNRDSFERFASRCKEQGVYAAAIENTRENRTALLIDLWRCGFTRVLVDYAPEYVNLSLADLCEFPNLSEIPLAERAVLNPEMTGSILWLMQQIHSGKADGGMELEMLNRLYHAAFVMPVIPKGGDAYELLETKRGDKRTVCLFTDHREWAAAGRKPEYAPAIVRYAELGGVLKAGYEQLVINPDTGAELVLDAQLLAAAEKAATGETEDLTIQSMQERGEKITVTDPESIPDELRQALTAVLQNHTEVETAYLRVLKAENSLRPNWLLISDRTEDRGEKAFHKDLIAAVMPYLGAYGLQCAALAKVPNWVGNAKPFYKKKKFGFLR